MSNGPLGELLRVAGELEPARVALLVDMARALAGDVEEEISSDSDVLTEGFAENFVNRLRIYHATNAEKFNKKAFEYAFVAAARYAGSSAEVLPNAVAPDADVEVDEVRFSLKTEAAKNLNPRRIHVSKFAEARWIRECQTPEDFAREAAQRIPEHLRRYERILTLRAFDVSAGPLEGDLPSVRYELWEVPRELLLRAEDLRPEDFAPRSSAGSSRADIKLGDGTTAFRLTLDGSVEKVTLAGIRTDLCRLHGAWTVPVLVAEETG